MASDYFDRLPAVENATFISAIHDFIASGRAQGWINDQYPFLLWFASTGTREGILVNATSPGFSRGVIQGNPYFTPFQGLTGYPAVSSCVLPGVRWSDVPRATANNHWFGCYLYADHNTGDTAIGLTGGGSTTAIRPHNGPNLVVNLNSATADSIRNNWSVGLILCARSDPSFAIVRAAGSETVVNRATAAALPGGPLGILSNGANSYGGSSVSLAIMGSDPGMANIQANRDGLNAAADRCMLALGAIGPGDLIPQTDNVKGAAAFGPGAMASVTPPGLKVWRDGIAPADTADNTNSTGFPGSAYNSVQTALCFASTSTRYDFSPRVWGCRALLGQATTSAGRQQHPNPVGPPIFRSDGRQVGTEYTTYDRADAATLAGVLYHLGNAGHQSDGFGYLDVLNAVGIPDTFVGADGNTYSTFLPYATVAATDGNGVPTLANALFGAQPSDGSGTWGVLRDVVVGPNARLVDAPSANLGRGLFFDWELSDLRSSAQGSAILIRIGQYLASHGYGMHLGTNALNGSVVSCGLNQSNLFSLLPYMEMEVVVTPSSPERDAKKSIINQLSLLTGANKDQLIPYANVVLTVGIGPFNGELTATDAAICRQWVLGQLDGVPSGVGSRTRPGGVRIANSYGSPGGLPTRRYNEIIATVLGLPVNQYVL